MALRVVLVSAAILPVPQVMAGRMTLSQPEAPEAGNHLSCTENRMISSSPIQKVWHGQTDKRKCGGRRIPPGILLYRRNNLKEFDMTMVRITEATARMIV